MNKSLTRILILFFTTTFVFQSCENKSKADVKFAKTEVDKKENLIKIDTIKRNDNITYNVTKDTIIGNLKISVANKNLDEQYIHQDFYLNDSIVVRNFYPEMETIITILKNDATIFKKTYFKNDFPEGNFQKFVKNSTIKDFKFERMTNETKEIDFIGTLYIPNTDFENDFRLTVTENGKSKLIWIDYESED